MKRLFAFSFCLLMCIGMGFAQEETQAPPLEYSEVVHVDGVSQDDLYDRAKVWFASAFNSANNVIQFDNKEQGMILGKAVIAYTDGLQDHMIKHMVAIYVKDGRYKYVINKFNHSSDWHTKMGVIEINFGTLTTSATPPKIRVGFRKKSFQDAWDKAKSEVQSSAEFLISSLKESMSQSILQDDNW